MADGIQVQTSHTCEVTVQARGEFLQFVVKLETPLHPTVTVSITGACFARLRKMMYDHLISERMYDSAAGLFQDLASVEGVQPVMPACSKCKSNDTVYGAPHGPWPWQLECQECGHIEHPPGQPE
jgi:hypothetical protein